MDSVYSENTTEGYGTNMKRAEIIIESGDIKVYCYINEKLDRVAVLPTMASAIQYVSDYKRI